MAKDMKITLSKEAACPGCWSPRMHTVDIYTGADEDEHVRSYIACSSCEEIYKVPITAEMQKIVDKIGD